MSSSLSGFEAIFYVSTISMFLASATYISIRVLRQRSIRASVLKSLSKADGLISLIWSVLLAGAILHTILEQESSTSGAEASWEMFDFMFSLHLKPSVLFDDNGGPDDVLSCLISVNDLKNTWLIFRISFYFAVMCAMTFALVGFKPFKPTSWARKEFVGALSAFAIGCSTLLCVIQAFVNIYLPERGAEATTAPHYVVFANVWEIAYAVGVMVACVAGVSSFLRCGRRGQVEECGDTSGSLLLGEDDGLERKVEYGYRDEKIEGAIWRDLYASYGNHKMNVYEVSLANGSKTTEHL